MVRLNSSHHDHFANIWLEIVQCPVLRSFFNQHLADFGDAYLEHAFNFRYVNEIYAPTWLQIAHSNKLHQKFEFFFYDLNPKIPYAYRLDPVLISETLNFCYWFTLFCRDFDCLTKVPLITENPCFQYGEIIVSPVWKKLIIEFFSTTLKTFSVVPYRILDVKSRPVNLINLHSQILLKLTIFLEFLP